MISHNRIECRVMLSPGVAASQRLQLMEIIEKWSLALTGVKPSKFVGASNLIMFAVCCDRSTTFEGLRRCLPGEFVRDVVIDGVSWSEAE